MSGNSLWLKNGRIIDPVNGVDRQGDFFVLNGQCAGGELDPKEAAGLPTFDLAGALLFPGFIDMHVHLREPGQEYKETVESGARAAAAGGFTAVACMPNTQPVNDSQTVVEMILAKARHAKARVYPIGAISQGGLGKSLAEYGEMKAAGAVALSDDGRPVADSQLMRRALEYAGNHRLTVISHSEEPTLSRSGAMNEGALATRLGLGGIPGVAEEIMVYRDLALAAYTGQPVHIAHISTRESVSLIRRAKKKGWPVTAETAPHYFTLTEEAVGAYNTLAKMNPPLRSAADREAIRAGLRDGTIDAIATDHAPHTMLEKEVEFDLAANGIIGLETAIPLTMALVRELNLPLARLAELMSINPARILGVAGGSLALGAPADLTVIDPNRHFVYRRETIVSKSRNSPFIDWALQGKAVLTILAGQVTHNEL